MPCVWKDRHCSSSFNINALDRDHLQVIIKGCKSELEDISKTLSSLNLQARNSSGKTQNDAYGKICSVEQRRKKYETFLNALEQARDRK